MAAMIRLSLSGRRTGLLLRQFAERSKRRFIEHIRLENDLTFHTSNRTLMVMSLTQLKYCKRQPEAFSYVLGSAEMAARLVDMGLYRHRGSDI